MHIRRPACIFYLIRTLEVLLLKVDLFVVFLGENLMSYTYFRKEEFSEKNAEELKA